MKGRLQVLSMLAPLFAATRNQPLAEEVVQEPIDEYLVGVLLRGQDQLHVLWFDGHKDGDHRDPNTDEGSVFNDTVFRLLKEHFK